LTIGDECTQEAWATAVVRQLTADHVLAALTELFIARGCPMHLRPDNGPEFCTKAVRERLHWLEARTLFIELGSPWENGCGESVNGKWRDELLDREIF
jgi:putative transposase